MGGLLWPIPPGPRSRKALLGGRSQGRDRMDASVREGGVDPQKGGKLCANHRGGNGRSCEEGLKIWHFGRWG